MKFVMVNLNSIDKVKRFSNIVNHIDINMDLSHDRYVVDAKSIMGIFSLDLTHSMKLSLYTDDEDEFNNVCEQIKDFIVEA